MAEEGVIWSGIREFNAAIDAMVARTSAANYSAVMDAAHAIEAATKDNAPVVSGTLRRSIMVDGPHAEDSTGAKASVGPTVAYGRRVELGFSGTDSIGRSFSSSGKPYFEPGVQGVMQDLPRIYAASWAKAIAL